MTSVFDVIATPSGTPIPKDEHQFHFDNYHYRVALSCLICLIVAGGVIGNGLLMTAVVLSRKLMTKTNAFVVNLGASGLMCCVVFPFNVHMTLYKGRDHQPPLSDSLFCAFVSLLTFVSVGACLVSLMLIGINRYFKIARPTLYDRIFGRWPIALMIIGSWLYPVILICVSHLDPNNEYGYSEQYQVCLLKDTSQDSDLVNALCDALIVLPTYIITLVAYALIYAHFKQHTTRQLAAAILRSLATTLRRRSQVVITKTANPPYANMKTLSGDVETALENLPQTIDGATTESSHHVHETLARKKVHQQDGMDERNNSSHQPTLHPQPRQQNRFAQLQVEQSRARIRKDQMEITKSLFIIVCVHILLITPLAIAIVIPNSHSTIPWLFTLFAATPATNPFVYGWKHPHFRVVFKAMLLCRFSQIPEPSKVARRLSGQLE